MKQFFKVKSVEEVLGLVSRFPPLNTESVDLHEAVGRVTALDMTSEEDLPEFPRSTMDGFAVRARDTFGAGESLPGFFTIVGEIVMGAAPDFSIEPGQCARIWTGGMMPQGSDAVVMVEYARQVDETTVELFRPVAPYENVIQAGEDVRKGQVLVPAGRRLRPQDIGLLAALGRERLPVVKTPKAAIVSTGDEIVPVDALPRPGQVRDINTFTLAALVRQSHAEPVPLGLVSDDPEHLRDAVARGLDRADTVLISGGSSVGVRDYTVSVLNTFDDSEILVHGVSVSPGKPTILARIGDRSVWGLPGHAVSAMVTCDLFVRPLLARLGGEGPSNGAWGRSVTATLSRSVPSVHGRQDYIRIRLEQGGNGMIAHPILGKSGLISTMVKADGLTCVDTHLEGLAQGAEVRVDLFD